MYAYCRAQIEAAHCPGTRLAQTCAMSSRRSPSDLFASTPRVSTRASALQLSRVSHAPVSESPQSLACSIARSPARNGERAAESTRILCVSMTLMAAVTSAAPSVVRADDPPVAESTEAERTPAWTAAKMRIVDSERPPEFEETPHCDSYATELAGAYIATPALAIGLGMAFGGADSPIGGWGFALTVLLASMPVPLTHLLNDRPGRALGTFVLTPALFFGGALLGAFVALGIIDATLTRDTPAEQEDGSLAHAHTALGIGIATGVLAVGIWAVVDVLDTRAPSARSSRPRALAQLRFGVAPRSDGATAVLAGRF